MKFFSAYGNYHSKEKLRVLSWYSGLHPAIKRKVIMRINFVAFLLFMSILNVHAATYAQSVTLSVRNKPLLDVLTEINKQTGYELIYNTRHFRETKNVTLSIKSSSLKEALDKCFEGQPLLYEIIDKTIVVKPKPEVTGSKVKPGIKKITITGRVLDEAGKVLSGVNVRVKGSEIKTSTNEQGSFIIDVPDIGAVLQFSFVGFQSLEHTVIDASALSIKLKQTPAQLEEVGIVSTGYQSLPKERATGSFVQIDNELLNRKISSNILERLNGISPGVFFNGSPTFNGNSTAGRLSTVSNTQNTGLTIRGQSSFSATTAQPLIVVDNFPYEGEVSNINPNDIESITVLKDAASASIWGARSGNGVIVITTKRGHKEQKMKVEATSNLTIIEKPDIFYDPNFLNTSSYIEAEKFLFDAGYFNSDISNKTSRPAVSPAVEIFAKERSEAITAEQAQIQLDQLRANDVRNDFDKFIYRKAVNQQYSLGVRGGGERLAYYLSAGYDYNKNELVGNSYNRLTFNSTNTFTPIQNLDLTVGLTYSNSKTVENNEFGFKQYTTTGGSKYNYIYSYAKLADESGNPLSIDNSIRGTYLDEMESKGFLDWHYRPLNEIRNNDYQTAINSLLLRFSAKYKIIPQLNVEFLYQNERQIIDVNNLKSKDTYYTRNLINKYSSIDPVTKKINYVFPFGGIFNRSNYDWNSHNSRLQFNYNQKFGKHELTAIGGSEIRSLENEGFTRTSYGYDDQFGTSVTALNFLSAYPTNPSGSARIPALSSGVSGFTNRYLSFFANAGYNYDSRYFITISGRKDGANIFGVKTNNRITPLWSAGLGWNISQESFYNVDWLSYLKIRASYGFNGNVNRNGTAFLTGTYSTDPITGAPMITGAKAPNPELRWEKIKNINIGVDFSILNNIISGTVEGFYKRGFDLFQATDLAPQTGFTSYVANAANSSAKGIDLNLQSHNLKGHVDWKTTFLISTLSDKILKYDPPITSNTITSPGKVVGYPMFAMFSYKWNGLNPINGNPRGYINGSISEDYAAIRNNYSPDSLIYNGSERPKVFGAFRNDFSYKAFSLSVNITYKLGYVFRRPTTSLSYRDVLTLYQNKDYDKRWQKSGDEMTTSVPSLVYPDNSDRNTFYQYSEVLIERGDHIRLQDIRLSYLFPESIFRNSSVQKLQLYAYGNNVGIIWKKNNASIDPDANLYPSPFSFSLGISANF